MTDHNLQQQIDNLPDGATLSLKDLPLEQETRIRIQTPLTLLGQGRTLWARTGPVLTIDTSGEVHIKNLNIEVENPNGEPGRANLAVAIERADSVTLVNVHVSGEVEGFDTSTIWKHARVLTLYPEVQQDSVVIPLSVPVPSIIRGKISNVEAISLGEAEGNPTCVVLRLAPGLTPGASLLGSIKIEPHDRRHSSITLPVAGWVVRTRFSTESPSTGGLSSGKKKAVPHLLLLGLLVALFAGIFWYVHNNRLWSPPTLRSSPRVFVSPQVVDFGVLRCSPRERIQTNQILTFTYEPSDLTNLQVTLTTSGRDENSGYVYEPYEEGCVTLEQSPTQWRLPLDYYSENPSAMHFTGTVKITVNRDEVQVVPDRLRMEFNIEPRRAKN
jgi:hypothetical protein